MKNIKIFAVATAVLLLASCNRSLEFEHETFATFDAVTFNVNENAGTLTIPVSIYNPTGAEVQVTVTGVDGKGVQGTDYEIVSPSSGILTFSGSTETQNVEINIIGKVGEFTGAKDFKVQIASATDGLKTGALNLAAVTIIDLDHPLAAFIGNWSGTITALYQSPSYNTTINISADETDETYTKLVFDTGIDPFFYGMGLSKATYSAVAASATEVVVLAEQPNGYDDVILLGFDNEDPDAATQYDHIRFVLQEDGTLRCTTAYGAFTPSQGGFYELYLGGAVFTKK